MAPTRAASTGDNRVVLGWAPGLWFFSCIVTPGLPLKPHGPQFPVEKGEGPASPLFLLRLRSKQKAHPAAGVVRSPAVLSPGKARLGNVGRRPGRLCPLLQAGVLVLLSPGVGQGGCLPDRATEASKSCLRGPLPSQMLRSGDGWGLRGLVGSGMGTGAEEPQEFLSRGRCSAWAGPGQGRLGLPLSPGC